MIIKIKPILLMKSCVCSVCNRLQSLILQTETVGIREFARFSNFLMQETLVPQCFPVCTYYVGDAACKQAGASSCSPVVGPEY